MKFYYIFFTLSGSIEILKIEDISNNILLPHTYVTGDIISQIIQLLRVTFNADITSSSFYELLILNN